VERTQKREAIGGMACGRRIAVTGAQCYDQWFDRAPSRDRASFCRASVCRLNIRLLAVCSVMTRTRTNAFVLR
jgi:hypothetical protein